MVESAPIFNLILSSLLCVALRVVKPPNSQPSNTNSAQEHWQVFPQNGFEQTCPSICPTELSIVCVTKLSIVSLRTRTALCCKVCQSIGSSDGSPKSVLRFVQRSISILVADHCAEVCLPIGRNGSPPKSVCRFATEQSRRPVENVTRL